MNRVAMLACLVLAGCPKASAPAGPSPSAPEKQQPAVDPVMVDVDPPDPELPKEHYRFFESEPGVTTLAQFRETHPKATKDEAPDDLRLPGVECWIDLEPRTFAGRQISDPIQFWFLNGVLHSVYVRNVETREALGVLTEKHGRPRHDDNAYRWRSGGSAISLERSDGFGGLDFYDIQLTNAVNALDKERIRVRQQASDAKDL